MIVTNKIICIIILFPVHVQYMYVYFLVYMYVFPCIHVCIFPCIHVFCPLCSVFISPTRFVYRSNPLRFPFEYGITSFQTLYTCKPLYANWFTCLLCIKL